MIDITEQADHETRKGIERWLQVICGPAREFPVHHQVVNWLFFVNVFCLGVAGVENGLLGVLPPWQLCSASVAFAAFYCVTRILRRWVSPLSAVSLAMWLFMVETAWFTSGGLLGATPTWMFMGVVWLSIFRKRLARTLSVALWLGEFGVLTGIQIAAPRLIQPYSSPMVAYVDTASSIALVSLYLIGYVLILSYNLEQRQRQAEGLLLNILPRRIAEELEYSRGHSIAEYVERGSVLFADVAGFTPLSAGMSANDLVELLNEVFSAFDQLVEQRGLEKIKTIGDCYMVAAGVPESREDHACILADLALAMQEYVNGRIFKGKELMFRIGISSGPLVAGVIGRKKFIYDLWGDTVNTASRMESHGVAGCVQVTEATRVLIQNEFCVEPRGEIAVKGKGEMPVWLVTGRRHPQLA